MRVLILMVFAALAGCSDSPKYSDPEFIDVISKGDIRGNAVFPIHDRIIQISLKDGTRCALYRYKGGIDCDWQPLPEPPE